MRIFNNILRESFSDLNGYNADTTMQHYMAYKNIPENFMAFAVSVNELLPLDCELNLNEASMSFQITYKRRDVVTVYASVNDKEAHCFIDGEKMKAIRFGQNVNNAAERFVKGLSDKFSFIENEIKSIRQKEMEYLSNLKKMMSIRPDSKDFERAKSAMLRSGDYNKYFALWKQQDNKMTDNQKRKRRLMAFFTYMKDQDDPNLVANHGGTTQYNAVLGLFKQQIDLKARYGF